MEKEEPSGRQGDTPSGGAWKPPQGNNRSPESYVKTFIFFVLGYCHGSKNRTKESTNPGPSCEDDKKGLF
jgi:hypothetical protein